MNIGISMQTDFWKLDLNVGSDSMNDQNSVISSRSMIEGYIGANRNVAF